MKLFPWFTLLASSILLVSRVRSCCKANEPNSHASAHTDDQDKGIDICSAKDALPQTASESEACCMVDLTALPPSFQCSSSCSTSQDSTSSVSSTEDEVEGLRMSWLRPFLITRPTMPLSSFDVLTSIRRLRRLANNSSPNWTPRSPGRYIRRRRHRREGLQRSLRTITSGPVMPRTFVDSSSVTTPSSDTSIIHANEHDLQMTGLLCKSTSALLLNPSPPSPPPISHHLFAFVLAVPLLVAPVAAHCAHVAARKFSTYFNAHGRHLGAYIVCFDFVPNVVRLGLPVLLISTLSHVHLIF